MLIEARKIIMPTWDQNYQASIKAWEDISSEYATCASGTVTKTKISTVIFQR